MSTLYEGNRVGDPRVYKDIAPTITARYGTGGNNVPLLLDDEFFVRKLTPVECERLQGFPDNWTDGQSTADRYKQIGNAVTVNIAEWIGRRL